MLSGSLLLTFYFALPVSALPADFAPLYLLPALARDLRIDQSYVQCSLISAQPPLFNASNATARNSSGGSGGRSSVSYVSVLLLNELPAGLTVGSLANALSADIRSGALQAQLGPALPVPCNQSLVVSQMCSGGRLAQVPMQCHGGGPRGDSDSALTGSDVLGLSLGLGVGGALLLALACVALACSLHRRMLVKEEKHRQSDRQADNTLRVHDTTATRAPLHTALTTRLSAPSCVCVAVRCVVSGG